MTAANGQTVSRPPDLLEAFDRLPRADDAEAAVIGSVLIDPAVLPEVQESLTPDDFFDERHQTVYRATCELAANTNSISIQTLGMHLQDNGLYDTIGGAGYFVDKNILGGSSHARYIRYYVDRVLAASRRRQLHSAMASGLQSVAQGDAPHDSANALLAAVTPILDCTGSKSEVSVKAGLQDAIERLERTDDETVISSGWPQLDHQLGGGFRRQQLVVVAARTSIGKSILLQQLAFNAALASYGALMVSYEMPAKELWGRLLSQRSGIGYEKIRTRDLTADERRRLIEQASRDSQLDSLFTIKETHDMTAETIGAYVRQRKLTQPLDVLVVDYLQLIGPTDPKRVREEQVAHASWTLKRLAKELDIVVLAAAQINRESEKDKDKRPKLHHLRESGAIEQDCDVVILIHREDKRSIEAELDVAKNRSGRIGIVPMLYQSSCVRFVERAPDRFEEFDQWNDN